MVGSCKRHNSAEPELKDTGLPHETPPSFQEALHFREQMSPSGKVQQTKGGDPMSSGIIALEPRLVRATVALEQPLASAWHAGFGPLRRAQIELWRTANLTGRGLCPRPFFWSRIRPNVDEAQPDHEIGGI